MIRELLDRARVDPVRAYLLPTGVMALLTGIGWLLMRSPGRQVILGWLPFMSFDVMGVMWILVAVAALIGFGSLRWRMIALAAIVGSSFLTMSIYFVSFFLSMVPDAPLRGNENAFTVAVLYFGIWATAVVMAQVQAVRE